MTIGSFGLVRDGLRKNADRHSSGGPGTRLGKVAKVLIVAPTSVCRLAEEFQEYLTSGYPSHLLGISQADQGAG